MDGRIVELINVFLENGWIKSDQSDIPSDWWFEDIIKLKSFWRPTGKSLFITFLTDPEFLKKKVVWAIGISSAIPSSRNFEFIKIVSLNEITRIDLRDLVVSINNIILVK